MDIKAIVLLVLTALIGISLVSQIGVLGSDLTTIKTISEEPVTFVLGDTCQQYTTYDNFYSNSSVVIGNANSTLAAGTDYQICSLSAGTISPLTAAAQGAGNATYQYYPDEYMQSNTARLFINLIPFGFILAILLAAFFLTGVR